MGLASTPLSLSLSPLSLSQGRGPTLDSCGRVAISAPSTTPATALIWVEEVIINELGALEEVELVDDRLVAGDVVGAPSVKGNTDKSCL